MRLWALLPLATVYASLARVTDLGECMHEYDEWCEMRLIALQGLNYSA